MTAIPVTGAGRIVGHSTPSAAFAAVMRHPRQPRAKADGALFAGRTFVDAWCDHRQSVIAFSGPLWLRVFVVEDERRGDVRPDGFVDWKVEQERPAVPSVTEPIVLDWGGDIGTSTTDCAALAADRRGAEFWQFFVNEGGFNVYVRRKLILCFHGVRRRDTGALLLFVCEDD